LTFRAGTADASSLLRLTPWAGRTSGPRDASWTPGPPPTGRPRGARRPRLPPTWVACPPRAPGQIAHVEDSGGALLVAHAARGRQALLTVGTHEASISTIRNSSGAEYSAGRKKSSILLYLVALVMTAGFHRDSPAVCFRRRTRMMARIGQIMGLAALIARVVTVCANVLWASWADR
jgi:hypothetical protein